MIVVDASVILEVLLRTPDAQALESRLLGSGDVLCAPHLIDVEVAQVLRRYHLAGELTASRGREALLDLADFPLERFPHTTLLDRIWAVRDNVTAYDGAYVALAEALESPLVTRDGRLARSQAGRVPIEVV